MNQKQTILLVEDDHRFAHLVQEYLEKEGFEVDLEHRGDTAVSRIIDAPPDLLVLDLMLPGMDGFAICREIRPHYRNPILMLTARDEDIDQIVGLELGADDYITKPIEPRLLLARLRAHLRRTNESSPPLEDNGKLDILHGRLIIDPHSRSVNLDGKCVELTTSEFDLLLILASGAGNILNRDAILQAWRGIEYDGLDRSVDIAVSRLRRKLNDDASPPQRIKTVRRRGYLFVPDAWE
ncbi:MAG: response regulator [gamma proteobacterium endosymbiont of Lamellibrachia anaximandri]|nr:response regulator [gamma proteobacterium endosymbiont of Lamellibrachia anaximandri]